jgi:hypothetical protein
VQTDVGETTGALWWRACTVLRSVSCVEGANQALKRRTRHQLLPWRLEVDTATPDEALVAKGAGL